MGPIWEYPSASLLLENQYVKVTPINLVDDLGGLYAAASLENNGGEDLFKFYLNGPVMENNEVFKKYVESKLASKNQFTYKVFSKRFGRIVGCFSLMNIKFEHGTIEVGSVWYEKKAQKTEINSNTMLALFTYVFEELKYRRLELKCNNLNEESKAAAIRLEFEYEGLFRQHFISRGRNRDTAWYSIIDKEWGQKKSKLIKRMGKHA